jgi:DNA-binding response OmpR family regulator
VFLLREAIASAGLSADLQVVTDGEKAIEFIDRIQAGDASQCPDLIILDLNLPKRTGSEVLHHLRNTEKCRETPVLIVTSSDSEQDREKVSTMGTSGYFRKPSAYAAFMKVGAIVRDLLDKP